MRNEEYKKMKSINLAIVSNIVFDPYIKTSLINSFSKQNINVNIFSVFIEDYDLMSINEMVTNVDLIFVALNFERLYPNYPLTLYEGNSGTEEIVNNTINLSKTIYDCLLTKFYVPVIWLNFEDYYMKFKNIIGNVFCGEYIVDSINLKLQETIHDCIFIDLKRLIANVGIFKSYDFKGKYRWSNPYSKELVESISTEIYKQYLILHYITKKCIVLDCDQVLWGGILEENGFDCIRIDGGTIGKPFQDFQRMLLYLYYHGVILCVCSKNDESNVLNVFKEHSGMILKEQNIACFMVNWDNKPTNIKKISDYLNIGLDSIVFIDDSEEEIAEVNSILPEVFTIKYNNKTIYENLTLFSLNQHINLTNVNNRTNAYKTKHTRNALKKLYQNQEEYLRSLKIIIDIHQSIPSEFLRISELTQKTNKMTNGIRYTFYEIERISKSEYNLFSVFLKDKFSDFGLVGVIGINGDTLDLFSLSCRAFGKGVEEKMISFIKKYNIKKFIFQSTSKNDHVYELINKNIKNCQVL